MKSITFIDTETTGLDPRVHEAWEIAAVKFSVNDHGQLIEEVQREHFFLHPYLPDADVNALRFSNYYERTKSIDWSDEGYAAETLAHMLAPTDTPFGPHIAGMNITFDRDMIQKLLYSNGHAGVWNYHLIEMETMMFQHLHFADEKPPFPWSSSDLSRMIGVDPKQFERHTAMGDADWCVAVWATLVGLDEESASRDGKANVPDWAKVEG